MTTTTRIWLTGALIGLAVLVGAEAGWAACCKCSPCVDEGVACFTLATELDCTEICPVAETGFCNFDSFSAEATCGQGDFADCTFINGQLVRNRAPAMSLPALGVTAIGLLVAGIGLAVRGARRSG
jgi:hypothetical protein